MIESVSGVISLDSLIDPCSYEPIYAKSRYLVNGLLLRNTASKNTTAIFDFRKYIPMFIINVSSKFPIDVSVRLNAGRYRLRLWFVGFGLTLIEMACMWVIRGRVGEP